MQTKQEIQRLLAGAGVWPDKRLGQHFLIDLNLMRYLLDSSGIGSGDVALEVGCGTGSLTEGLAKQAGCVIAVEVDEILAQISKGRLIGAGDVEIINDDILETKHKLNRKVLDSLEAGRDKFEGRVFLISNLPYNVAAPVMLNLITGADVADCMYVTVQKEVAQRMAASPGSKHYGVLSIFMAATGEVKVLKTLRPSVFWPAPAVDSAMVSYIRDSLKAERIKSMEIFSGVVNLFMQHRRKMVKACVKFAEGRLAKIENWSDIFEAAGVDGNCRPEELSADKYVNIANACFRSFRQKNRSLGVNK